MKYAPSALIGRLSRSAGSTTASHNRFGAYLRNRVIPTNPQSPGQLLVRASLAAAAATWRTITAGQRAAWTALGGNIHRQDTLGQDYTLTGSQAFVAVNRNQYTAGNAQVTDAPAYSPPAALLTLTPTATSV